VGNFFGLDMTQDQAKGERLKCCFVNPIEEILASAAPPVKYDLGGRTLDILYTPGHEDSSICVYDPQTNILNTGDLLYPGRLYVNDNAQAFKQSALLLKSFVDTSLSPQERETVRVCGGHIEFHADLDRREFPSDHQTCVTEETYRNGEVGVGFDYQEIDSWNLYTEPDTYKEREHYGPFWQPDEAPLCLSYKDLCIFAKACRDALTLPSYHVPNPDLPADVNRTMLCGPCSSGCSSRPLQGIILWKGPKFFLYATNNGCGSSGGGLWNEETTSTVWTNYSGAICNLEEEYANNNKQSWSGMGPYWKQILP